MYRLSPIPCALALALPLTASAARCPSAVASAELEGQLESAEEAFGARDLDRFDLQATAFQASLPCLAEPVTPSLAARYHRVDSLRLYLDGTLDPEGEVLQSVRAARALEPDHTLSDQLLPEGHELRQAYEQTPAEPDETRRLPEPRDLTLLFDGQATRERPTQRATLLQVVDGQGAILQTAVLRPDDPLPYYQPVPRARRRLVAGTAITGGLAALMYGAAWATRARFESDRPQTVEELEQLARQSWTLSAVSLGAAGVAAVGGTTALLISDTGFRRAPWAEQPPLHAQTSGPPNLDPEAEGVELPATVVITGDADQFILVSEGVDWLPGEVPPGTYQITMIFDDGTDQVIRELTLAPGEELVLSCSARSRLCK